MNWVIHQTKQTTCNLRYYHHRSIYFNRETFPGREGVVEVETEDVDDFNELDVVFDCKVEVEDEVEDEVVPEDLATGIELGIGKLLASFKNLFGLPSSHWFTWLANRNEHNDS